MTTAIGGGSAAAWSNALFDKIDTKRQGYIDQAQLEEAFGAEDADAAQALMAKLDTDSDGKVTKSELSSAVDKLAEALDAQRDGARVGPPPGGHGPRPPQAAGAAEASGSTTCDPADTDQDGSVSQAEQAAFDTREAERRREADPQRELARALHLLKAYAEQPSAGSGNDAAATPAAIDTAA
jgi:hypothetical protein